jgi:hypothetical protein
MSLAASPVAHRFDGNPQAIRMLRERLEMQMFARSANLADPANVVNLAKLSGLSEI